MPTLPNNESNDHTETIIMSLLPSNNKSNTTKAYLQWLPSLLESLLFDTL